MRYNLYFCFKKMLKNPTGKVRQKKNKMREFTYIEILKQKL